MIVPTTVKTILAVIATLLATSFSWGQGAPSGSVARVVVWQPKPGMSRDFEQGYKRHLDWHRRNNDSWVWYGWMISSGEHDGEFMDGTFFHQWTDFDNPVSPAQDGADNGINVEPYADVKSVAAYEAVSPLDNVPPSMLNQPLMTVCFFDVQTDRAHEFESMFQEVLKASGGTSLANILFRPVNGSSEYLLFLPGQKASELGPHGAFISRLLAAQRSTIVLHYRTEMARFRPDMSYQPNTK